MFDSIMIDCPCGEKIEFQSKAGPCRCDEYLIQDAPPAIAGDVMNESKRCDNCKRKVTLRGAVVLLTEWTPAP